MNVIGATVEMVTALMFNKCVSSPADRLKLEVENFYEFVKRHCPDSDLLQVSKQLRDELD